MKIDRVCCTPESRDGNPNGCGSDIKETKSGAEPCPECGKQGWHVPDTAVYNLLKEEAREKMESGNYHICVSPDCNVVYYNPLNRTTFDKDSVRVKVWLKDSGDDVPLCYCNEITRGKIKEAWQKGSRTYTEVVNITGAAKGKCNCKYENPAGRCCSSVIKQYLEELGENALVNNSDQRKLEIEFLYLDLSSCTWCQNTESNLDEAISEVAQILRAAGIEVKVIKIHIQTEEQAREMGFVSSPTIRVNGNDIQLDIKESECQSCGDLCGETVDCRIWTYQGKEYTAPPKAMIIDAVLREVYGGTKEKSETKMNTDVPENLKKFFAAKRRKDKTDNESGGCCQTGTKNTSC